MLTINPTSWSCLILWSLFISFGIRILNSLFRSRDETDRKIFWDVFKGTDDLWLPYLIGSVEIAAYSLFIKADVLDYIGAWLAFKTVNRWLYTPDPDIKRGQFNRYLFANGAVLVAAFVLARTLYA